MPKGGRTPNAQYKVRTKVWRYPGKGGWHFANLSTKQSAEIRVRFEEKRRGWGSLLVRVRIGRAEWDTSIFPDRKHNSYMFAIKAAVRREENIGSGDTVTALVTIR